MSYTQHISSSTVDSTTLRSTVSGIIAQNTEERDARQKMYRDGVDDYAMVGFCDTGRRLDVSKMQDLVKLMEEQEANGKLRRSYNDLELVRESDGKVFSKVVKTRYGVAFVSEDGEFVSVSKKLSTYHKKGFKTFSVKYSIEYRLTGHITNKMNFVIESSKVVDLVKEEITKDVKGVYFDNTLGYYDHLKVNTLKA